jgi:hypothetical protein
MRNTKGYTLVEFRSYGGFGWNCCFLVGAFYGWHKEDF